MTSSRSEQKNEYIQDSILVWPKEVVQHMLKFLDNKDIAFFARQSNFALKDANDILLQRKSDKLTSYIVNGEEKEARMMLEADPKLLLIKGTAQAKATQLCVKKAPLQAAEWADEKYMLEWMVPLFDSHYGVEKRLEQYQQRCTAQEFKNEAQRCDEDITRLNNVIQAISDAKGDTEAAVEIECSHALNAFHTYLNEQAKRTDLAKQFNLQLLVAVFNLYYENYGRFGNSADTSKNKLVWIKIIGYIERFIPTAVAQAFCQGPYEIVNGGKALTRSLQLRHASISYFDFSKPISGKESARLYYLHTICCVTVKEFKDLCLSTIEALKKLSFVAHTPKLR